MRGWVRGTTVGMLSIAVAVTGGSPAIGVTVADRVTGPGDALDGTIELVSVTSAGDPGGAPGTSYQREPAISQDGRFVAFCTAQKLVPEDTNDLVDVYLRDRQARSTSLVGLTDAGQLPNAASCGFSGPTISGDGRLVGFESSASNLVDEDTNGGSDIFVRDTLTGRTTRESVPVGVDSGWSWDPEMSADGRWLVFESDAKMDPDRPPQGLFLKDRLTGKAELVSVGSLGQRDCCALDPEVSGDGRYVVFTSGDSTLVPGDTNNATDVFLRDRVSKATERITVMDNGVDVNTWAMYPGISGNGRYVTFSSLIEVSPGNDEWQVYLHDRRTADTAKINVGTGALHTAIARDGRSVVYSANVPTGRRTMVYDIASGVTGTVTVSIYEPDDSYTAAFDSAVADRRAAVALLDGSANLVAGVGDTNPWQYYAWSADDPLPPLPGAPVGVSGVPGNGKVTVSWSAPADNGASPVTGYTAVANPGGATCTVTATTCEIAGLSNGQAYTFTVTAYNGDGEGPASAASDPVVPRTVPGAPTGVSGVPGTGEVMVSWNPPSDDGGAAITSYTAVASPGGATCSTGTTMCAVRGLTNGQPYTFTVKATNVAGDGAASDPSAAVTPVPLVQSAKVTLPKRIKYRGTTVLLESAVWTDAGLKAKPRVTVSPRGKKYSRVRTTAKGKVVIKTLGKRKLKVTLSLAAPGTERFSPFSFTKTWKVRR